MGKQITFYLTVADSQRIEKELLDIEPSTLVYSRSRGPYPREYSENDESKTEARWLFMFLVRRADLNNVVTEEVPTQGYWSIQELYSPVVQLIRSNLVDGVLTAGRLYYIESYYDRAGNLVCKSDEFRDWAKKLLSKARRLLTYDKELSSYLGYEAMELRREGNVSFSY